MEIVKINIFRYLIVVGIVGIGVECEEYLRVALLYPGNSLLVLKSEALKLILTDMILVTVAVDKGKTVSLVEYLGKGYLRVKPLCLKLEKDIVKELGKRHKSLVRRNSLKLACECRINVPIGAFRSLVTVALSSSDT